MYVTSPRSHLGEAQPHITVGRVLIKTKPERGRAVCVEEEVLVAEGCTTRSDRSDVMPVIVYVQRVRPLIPLVKRNPHPYDILRVVKVVLNPAPVVVGAEYIPLARPARVGAEAVVAGVGRFAAAGTAP